MLTQLNRGGVILPLLFIVIATIQTYITYQIPTVSSITYLSTAFYLAGHFYSHSQLQQFISRHNATIAAISAITLYTIAIFWSGSMEAKHLDVPLYFGVGLCGTLMTLAISQILSRTTLCRALDWVGRNTLTILTYHFLAFKLVSLVIIFVYRLPIAELSSFPVIGRPHWWIAYCAVGVTLPLTIPYLKTITNNRFSFFK